MNEFIREELKGVKGFIFDYGGTIDSGGDHWSEVIWRGWQKGGVDIGKEIFREAYVFAERELARTRHILPHHNFHDLLLIKMRIELMYVAELGQFPSEGVEAKAREIAGYCYEAARMSVERARVVLDVLREKKYPMVLVSNFYGNISTVLEDFKLGGYFIKIIESAVVGIRKPDPAIFSLGVEALELNPEEVMVVGDSYGKDIAPAESLGCKVAWLKGKGWTPEEDARTHPAAIASLEELIR